MSKKIYSWSKPAPPQPKRQSKPSCTVPDQTMTVRTLMDRYRRGMPLDTPVKKPLYYNGEFPDIAGLDLTEIQALKKQAAQQVAQYQQDLQNQERAKYNEKQRAIQEEITKLKNQIQEYGNQARGKVEGEART